LSGGKIWFGRFAERIRRGKLLDRRKLLGWCGREDLNLHDLAATSS
jgi:hypothetical protein